MTRHEQCENSASKRASSSLGARAARPRGAPSGATDLAKCSILDVSLVVDVSLALRARGGRLARAPSARGGRLARASGSRRASRPRSQ